MLFQRFYDETIAQTSYLVGCQRTGEAAVLDANRGIERYLEAAASQGLRITAVTETHIHADFVSGSRELARATGATLYLSDEGGPDWHYAYANEPGTVRLRHGDIIRIGNVRLEAIHTPGHTPEHLAFLLTDGAATDRPMGLFTGDVLFVGDVGRPDLLERAAKMAGTMTDAARTLFQSLQRLRAYPDYLQIWPGHGAGSACGKALGAVPQSTLGYEKLTNWAFGVDDEADFVASVLAGQPEPPVYFAEMKSINREGPPPRRLAPLTPVDPEKLPAILASGATMLDVRSAAAFAAGHVRGAVNIPFNASFTTWAGWLVPYTTDIYLIVDDRQTEHLLQLRHQLATIGLDRIAGYVGADAVHLTRTNHSGLATIPQMSPSEALSAHDRHDITLLDVRNRAEWDNVRIRGALHIPLGELASRLDELPRDRPIAVHCLSGARSAIAASVLDAHGIQPVYNVAGGLQAWLRAELPTDGPSGLSPS